MEQFEQVIGIAWSGSDSASPVTLTNAALGLRPVEVAKVVRNQQFATQQLVDENTTQRNDIARLEREQGSMKVQKAEFESLKTPTGTLNARLEMLEKNTSSTSIPTKIAGEL